jgi:hypothetical protein
LNQVLRRADAHQVSRLTGRHFRRNFADDVPHDCLLFPDTQAANGITVKPDINRTLQALTPKIEMRTALDNPKNCLLTVNGLITVCSPSIEIRRLHFVKHNARAFGPSCGQLHTLPGNVMRSFARRTFVKRHDNLRAEGGLNFHRHFR